MPRTDRVCQKRLADSGPSGLGSSSDGLAPEIQAESRRRLAGAALLYAGAWIAAFGVSWFQVAVEHPAFMPTVRDFVNLGLAVALSLGVFLLARSCRFPAKSFFGLAIAFEILAAIGIHADMWGWQKEYAEVLDIYSKAGLDWSRIDPKLVQPVMVMGVPWGAVWLLVFPLVVPMPLRHAIFASIATAATIPAILLGSQWVGGTPESVRPYVSDFYFNLLLPTAIAVGMAIYACHVIYRLNRDLSRARQFGSYEMIEKLGEGGMGEVWKARHRMLVRPAAIKLIRPEVLGRGDVEQARTLIRRFEREAQATSALRSPHTIEIYDFGISEEGVFYYVMELLDGIDLRSLIEKGGPLPASRTLHILRDVCHSLADAHASGLIHRDIKPANIFVTRRGLDYDFVKVLDFGLVKESGRPSSVQLTQEGSTTGTPAFMAPEVAMGIQEIDHRADLYALGCVGYWLLTGQLVFDGPNPMAILLKAAKDAPVPPSRRTEIEVAEEMDEVILACLARDPADRPQSARELSRRLSEVEAKIGVWTPDQAEKWWRLHQPEEKDHTVEISLPGVAQVAVGS